MAERKAYTPGTPSWVDLGVYDTQAMAKFYGVLFGWQADIDASPEAGGYGMFKLRGRNVAGIGPQINPGPPFWAVYVSVADADVTANKVSARGGSVLAGPMDVLDAGRMAVAQDSVGSYVSLWQPKAHLGAQLVNEPGAFIWNELATRDLPAAREFYTAVFGWGVRGSPASDQAVVFTVEGEVVCGAHSASHDESAGWVVWFAVEDCDASLARALELGGRVLTPPVAMGFGRGAVLADPQGSAFGIAAVKPATPTSSR